MSRFDTVLIANRGEIARRIIRAAHALGLRAAAVYSEADRDARFVHEADIALPIGPADPAQSYLDPERLIAAAQLAGAGAVHPGYGFLSENAGFARRVNEAGLIFVGPPAEVIATMGDKTSAKAAAEAAGVPVLPGYRGADQSDARLSAEAARLGTPLLIKASAGGGGRGIRRVDDLSEFSAALDSARREAASAFGDASVLLERCLDGARHVEVQVLADHHGGLRHLWERDCSLQSAHQKVIEEAPAPRLPAPLRDEICDAAIRLARHVGYRNAGTVEFLYEPASGAFHFLEMNTRLQVEHPVTEAITGIDIVRWQLEIAQGAALNFDQDALALDGAAIEARIQLRAGTRVTQWQLPHLPGLRLDSAVEAGSSLSHHYDPMIAKLIAHGADRAEALARLRQGLAALRIEGISTNRAELLSLLSSADFAAARLSTDFIARHDRGAAPAALPDAPAIAALALVQHRAARNAAPAPWAQLGNWRVTAPCGRNGASFVTVDVTTFQVTQEDGAFSVTDPEGTTLLHAQYTSLADDVLDFEAGGRRRLVRLEITQGEIILSESGLRFAAVHGEAAHAPRTDAGTDLTAPMPGLVTETPLAPGSPVRRGDPVVVFEAMKLVHSLTAPCDGILAELPHPTGSSVSAGTLLARIEPKEPSHD